jgi:cytochrome b involved in lipid metabolism
MSHTFNIPQDLSCVLDIDEQAQRESVAGEDQPAPLVLLPTPQMRKNRLDQSRSRGSTPVSTTRSLDSASPVTNIDDLLPASLLDDDSMRDSTVGINAQFANFNSSLADRDLYRKKIHTGEGFSHRDWLTRIKTKDANLTDLPFISPDELAQHNSRNDCWIAIAGLVYNLTDYLPFHPGGVDILIQNCGKDASNDFNLTHSFVNHNLLLGKYQVGWLMK